MNFSTNLRLERDFEERSTAHPSFFKLPKNFLPIFFSFLFIVLADEFCYVTPCNILFLVCYDL